MPQSSAPDPGPAPIADRDAAVRARESLNKASKATLASHRRGASPLRVGAQLTAAADLVVSELWRETLARLGKAAEREAQRGCCLVAHGGYGRRQLAPRSDLDLMLLHRPESSGLAQQLSGAVTATLFDAGANVGHSVRTIDDTVSLATSDAVVATSLLESRSVIGASGLYERYLNALTAAVRRHPIATCEAFVSARRRERERFGETVYLLEPNVKRSRGGLRDVHLLRWLWFVQTGASDLDRLQSLGALSKFDHHRLTASRDFLLRVRNELHFTGSGASAAQGGDALTRQEQLRVAEALGYGRVRVGAAQGLLPVERFMRDYFRHASHVWFLATRMSELTTRRRSVARVFEPVLSRSIERDYRVGFTEISATPSGREKLRRDTAEALRLLGLARERDRRIAQDTWYTVYRAAPNLPDEPTPETASRFLDLMTDGRELGSLLRRAHDLGILERVVPAFRHARCLLQFNQYHKYTVDEHTFRAIEAATSYATRDDPLGEASRTIDDPAALHLALLLHDAGKGFKEDHSVVGERLARETGSLLGMEERRTERVALLVRRHLRMSHLAFRRNTNDPELLDGLARTVGDAQALAMLFVLTCADMQAVGPGVLTDWKIGVLADLYSRTLDRLADDPGSVEDRRRATRDAVWSLLDDDEAGDATIAQLFASLPESFLATRSARAVAGALRRMRRVTRGDRPTTDGVGRTDADAWGGYLDDQTTLDLIAAVEDGAGRGVFSAMAGALSSKGLRILSAETALVSGGVLLLQYTAEDPRAATNAAEANRRVGSITTAMVHAVDSDEPPEMPRVWGADRAEAAAALSAKPTEVRIDRDLSDECLIVEVFTVDRVGLLYELARGLHDLGFVIRFAKIATSLDQVVDVFYLTERDLSKPTGAEREAAIRDRLLTVISGPIDQAD